MIDSVSHFREWFGRAHLFVVDLPCDFNGYQSCSVTVPLPSFNDWRQFLGVGDYVSQKNSTSGQLVEKDPQK